MTVSEKQVPFNDKKWKSNIIEEKRKWINIQSKDNEEEQWTKVTKNNPENNGYTPNSRR